MQVKRIQNDYQTNFGMALKSQSWGKTANKLGKNLADSLSDAEPALETLAKKYDIKITPKKSRNLYNRGFNIVVSPIEYNIRGRDFIDRILKPAPYVAKTVCNNDVKDGKTMTDLLISTVKELCSDLKAFGYNDISSLQ